jgi:hypothetical protein
MAWARQSMKPGFSLPLYPLNAKANFPLRHVYIPNFCIYNR